MARWRDDDDAIPEQLARFIAAEWPGTDPAGQWGNAARQWLADHPGRSLPWAADPVTVRQRVVELRAELARAGHPAPGPPLRKWGDHGDEDGAWHD